MTSLLQQLIDPLSPTIPSQQLQAVTEKLLPIYQQRLKSLMEVTKIYQQTLLRDNQQGALKFMYTEEMRKYRVERQFELLKDSLLMEKQKILIKVLTTYHQLKKDYQQLQKQCQQQQKIIQSKTLSINNHLPEKDIQSFKLSILNTPKLNDSASRVTLLSNLNEGKSNVSVSLYEKMLQQKMILLKQMQKKGKALRQQNDQKSKQIARLQLQLKQSLSHLQQKKQCKNCQINQSTTKNLTKMNEKLTEDNEQNQLKLNQMRVKLKIVQEELQQKTSNIKNCQIQLVSLRKELEETKEKLEISAVEKDNKPSPQVNLQTIKELKEKLFLQEQHLMTLTNSFEFLKEDLSESLLNEVKRLRISHQILLQNIKTFTNNIKKEMTIFVTEIVESVKIKCSNKKNHDELIKTLRKMDNQLDFFIEQKCIKN